MTGWIWFVLVFGGVVILLTMLHTKRFFAALILTALQGVAAFFAANFAGGFFGVHLPLNFANLGIVSIGGTSAVIMLLLIHTIFKL